MSREGTKLLSQTMHLQMSGSRSPWASIADPSAIMHEVMKYKTCCCDENFVVCNGKLAVATT
jgi:hypothetical protein